MCRFASFVLTKDRAFWLDSDSHSNIIAHYKLHESGSHGLNVVKVEISPTEKLKRWHDYGQWKLTFDQDEFPEWHDPITSEKRARAALAQRAAEGFTTVDASGCTALTSLDAPKASYVYASGCTALTSLDAPKARKVYASNCTALTSLDAPKAIYVDASGCTALTSKDGKK